MSIVQSKPATAISSSSVNGSKEFGETCVISAGTVIEGKFTSTENIRLDGFVKGEIKCSQRLVMGEDGKVEGNIFAREAIIMGKVEGKVKVEGTLQLKSTGLIKGSIISKYMVVEEGAQYVGDCKIGD